MPLADFSPVLVDRNCPGSPNTRPSTVSQIPLSKTYFRPGGNVGKLERLSFRTDERLFRL